MQVRTLNDIMIPVKPKDEKDWLKLRNRIKAAADMASGSLLLRDDSPVNAQVFGKTEYDGFAVEKVILETLPGLYIAGNIFRPLDTDKKYPAVLNPHGHSPIGRFDTNELGNIPGRCINQALRGMVAFTWDLVGSGDSLQLPHHYTSPECDRYAFGRFALQVISGRKALDFVCGLPYVDSSRIGCTGASGGATQTMFLTLLDERITAAAPVNMASVSMQGGCCCENAPFLRRDFCNVDFAMMAAPRSLFMAASDGDWTIKSEDVEFPAVKRVYEILGAGSRFESYYRHAPHCYDRGTRERVYDFFCRAFGIENISKNEIDVEITKEQLTVGNIEERVPVKGFIRNDRMLLEEVKGIMLRNMASLKKAEKRKLIGTIFCLDEKPELSIPYTVSEIDGKKVIALGNCPANPDTMGAKYFSGYNRSEDARRVSALVRMIRENPDAEITAAGKSAYLASLALDICARKSNIFNDISEDGVYIPGIGIYELIRQSEM